MRYRERAEHLAQLLGDRLGVRGRDLQMRLRRAGRALPRTVRRDLAALAEAARLERHPRLARMLDHDGLDAAYRAALRHLEGIDRRRRRFDRLIGILASNAFNLLVIGAGLLAVMRWRRIL